jgi:glycosyltransferase involved in cell wall biosynthesis
VELKKRNLLFSFFNVMITRNMNVRAINIVSTSSYSRKFKYLGFTNASKGPSSVLASIINGCQELKVKHRIFDSESLSKLLKSDIPGGDYLIVNWTLAEEKLIYLLNSLRGRRVVIGPNISFSMDTVDLLLSNPELYHWFIVPSVQVLEKWQNENLERRNLKFKIWQSGIDTGYWSANGNKARDSILIYIKGEVNPKELNLVVTHLKENNYKFEIIKYGEYSRDEFRLSLSHSKCAIWLANTESQGLALLEAWSCGVPTLVRVKCSANHEMKEECINERTFAPYLNESRGRYLHSVQNIEFQIKHFLDFVESQEKYNINCSNSVSVIFSDRSRTSELLQMFSN